MISPVLHEFTPVQNAPNVDSTLRVLTYNVLSNVLLRPSQYPTNGEAIRWHKRWPLLQAEIKAYHPDVLMLQEVDRMKTWEWGEFFQSLGMQYEFVTYPRKDHGVCIAWRTDMPLRCKSKRTVQLDEFSGLKQQDHRGTQVGLVAVFETDQTPPAQYIMATTHLTWLPEFAYERLRQFVLLLEAVQAEDKGGARIIVGGDFNCMPHTPLSRCFFENQSALNLPELKKQLETSARSMRSRIPVFRIVPAVSALLERVQKLRRYVALRSVYLEALGAEPAFTNWTDDFRETLDYILVSEPLKVRAVLSTPTAEEMGREPSSIPRIRDGKGRASDHVPLGVELYEPSESSEPQGELDSNDSKETKETKAKDSKETKDSKEAKDSEDSHETKDSKDSKDSKEAEEAKETKETKDSTQEGNSPSEPDVSSLRI